MHVNVAPVRKSMEIPSWRADSGAGRKLAGENAKIEGHLFGERIVAAHQSLQLTSAEF